MINDESYTSAYENRRRLFASSSRLIGTTDAGHIGGVELTAGWIATSGKARQQYEQHGAVRALAAGRDDGDAMCCWAMARGTGRTASSVRRPPSIRIRRSMSTRPRHPPAPSTAQGFTVDTAAVVPQKKTACR